MSLKKEEILWLMENCGTEIPPVTGDISSNVVISGNTDVIVAEAQKVLEESGTNDRKRSNIVEIDLNISKADMKSLKEGKEIMLTDICGLNNFNIKIISS